MFFFFLIIYLILLVWGCYQVESVSMFKKLILVCTTSCTGDYEPTLARLLGQVVVMEASVTLLPAFHWC